MHKVKTARPVAAAFGLFWNSPEGLIVPCEAYTINSDGRTTSGDHASAETLARAFKRGEAFLIYESYLSESDAARSAADQGAAYSVRPLPAGTFFYDGETLCVVAELDQARDESVFCFTNTPNGRAIIYGAVMGFPSPSDCVWLIPGTWNVFA